MTFAALDMFFAAVPSRRVVWLDVVALQAGVWVEIPF